jgi:hypothetical protein
MEQVVNRPASTPPPPQWGRQSHRRRTADSTSAAILALAHENADKTSLLPDQQCPSEMRPDEQRGAWGFRVFRAMTVSGKGGTLSALS